MPASTNPEEQEIGLPPPGQRWGAGAQSVLPYLTKSLQSKPASGSETQSQHAADGCMREHASAAFASATRRAR